MTNGGATLIVIYDAIDELNPSLDKELHIEKHPDAILFGQGGCLDSVGLVNLVVVIEQLVQERFEVAVTLADERAVSRAKSPFRSVRSLAEFVAERIAEAENDG